MEGDVVVVDLLSEQPLLFRGLVRTWPALGKWNKEFLTTIPDAQVRVWKQRETGELGKGPFVMGMTEFLRGLESEEEDFFVGNFPIHSVSESLQEDISNPCPQSPGDKGNLWIGKAGHFSHLHYDAHPGLLCCLEGVKKVQLWSPSADIALRNDAKFNVAERNPLEKEWDGPKPEYLFDLHPGDVLLIPFFYW